MIKKVLLGLLFLTLVFPFGVLAEDYPGPADAAIEIVDPFGCPPTSTTPCILEVMKYVIGQLIVIASPVLAAMVLFGGFQMIFANGSSEKFSKGRKTILYAAIGFAVIILSQGVAYVIIDLVKLGV